MGRGPVLKTGRRVERHGGSSPSPSANFLRPHGGREARQRSAKSCTGVQIPSMRPFKRREVMSKLGIHNAEGPFDFDLSPEESEKKLDELFCEAFETNHPTMLHWVSIKFELKRLRRLAGLVA